MVLLLLRFIRDFFQNAFCSSLFPFLSAPLPISSVLRFLSLENVRDEQRGESGGGRERRTRKKRRGETRRDGARRDETEKENEKDVWIPDDDDVFRVHAKERRSLFTLVRVQGAPPPRV